MIGTFDTGVKFSGDHTLIFFNHIIVIENGLPGVRSTLKKSSLLTVFVAKLINYYHDVISKKV